MAANEIDVCVCGERFVPRMKIERAADVNAAFVSRARNDQIGAQRERFRGDVVERNESALDQIDFHEELRGKQTKANTISAM